MVAPLKMKGWEPCPGPCLALPKGFDADTQVGYPGRSSKV